MKKALFIAATWWFLAIVPNSNGGWTLLMEPTVGAGFFDAADCDATARQITTANPEIAVTQCWNTNSPGGLQ